MLEFIRNGSFLLLIVICFVAGGIIGHWIFFVTKQKSQKKNYRCVQCSSPIRPWENIPVLSYIIFPGRCKVCSWPIKPRKVTGEILGILIFLLIVLIIRFNA